LSGARERRFCASPAGTVDGPGGPAIRWHSSSFDGSLQPYALYVPASYDAARSWPLVLSLHGYSSDHILNLRRVFGRGDSPDEPECHAKTCFPKLPDVGFLVASPYGFGSLWYEGPAEMEVLDVLADVCASCNVDPDRIYLTGLSMGGGGTWHLGVRYPDLFAAIAPVCAPADYRLFVSHEHPLPAFEDELLSARSPLTLAGNLMHVPAKIFHGAEDDVVRPVHSRMMAARLRELGCHVEHIEFPDVDHDAWTPAYADASVFNWFRLFRRTRRPRAVEYATPSLRWPGAYWVRIDQIEKRPQPAVIRASVDERNTIDVGTSNVQAFSLKLELAPVDAEREILVVWNGHEAFRGIPEASELAFGDAGAGLRKRAGLEGPADDAFRDPYLLVYGTQGGDPEAIQAGREAADKLAHPDEWADIEVPVKADVDVADDDIRRFNLILLGNPRTNRLIERVNGGLPVRFDGERVRSGRRLLTGHDMGLIAICPNPLNPERYVVVLGGGSPATIRMAAEQHRHAPDYLVFDSSADFGDETTLRDWGYFDNGWRI